MIACKKGLTLATQVLNGMFTIVPVANFIQPLGLGWTNCMKTKLIITPEIGFVGSQKQVLQTEKKQLKLTTAPKFKFANYQKLVSQPQKEQKQRAITYQFRLANYKKTGSQTQKKQQHLSLNTKFRFANYKKPVQYANYKKQGQQQQKKQKNLTLSLKFKFANYQKPTPQPLKKQQHNLQKSKTNTDTDLPPTPSPTTQQSSNSKPLYTARDIFVIIMSGIGAFLWGQILFKQYYKKQPPIPLPHAIIQKVVQKQQSKPQQQQQSVGLMFILFLMCLFLIAAEFWRIRNFQRIYDELKTIHRVLKDEVHGIQLQLIRERLGTQ